MFRNLWHNSTPRELPKDVRAALASKFRLEEETLSRLRVLEKSGKYAGRRVRFIRIIDPTLLTREAASQLRYNTLDNGECRKAILFDGHIEKGGLVLIDDRRSRQGQPASTGVQ